MITWTVRGDVHGKAGNRREHWAQAAKRRAQERASTEGCALVQLRREGLEALRAMGTAALRGGPALVVTLTRVGQRLRDDDNNTASLACVRDQVAALLGTGDAPSAPVTWVPRQERSVPPERPCVRVSVAQERSA